MTTEGGNSHAYKLDGINDKVLVELEDPFNLNESTVLAKIYINKFNRSNGITATTIISGSDSKNGQEGYILRAIYNPTNNKMHWQIKLNDDSNSIMARSSALSYDKFESKYSNKWLLISSIYKGNEYLKLLITEYLVIKYFLIMA
jgi:hypothetical protein